MIVEITTDGSCFPNPGPGGWASLLRYGQHAKAIYGWSSSSTNIKMEMTAAIEALEFLKRPCHVVLTTDSEYVMKGITVWIHRWKRNNWTTAGFEGKPPKEVANRDLWERLDKARERHVVTWQWTRGHQDNKDNIYCDQLAVKARKEHLSGGLVLSAPMPEASSLPIQRGIDFSEF